VRWQTPHRPIGFRRLLRIRTVAQFESANYRRFQATVRPDAANWKANCRCSGAVIYFVFSL